MLKSNNFVILAEGIKNDERENIGYKIVAL